MALAKLSTARASQGAARALLGALLLSGCASFSRPLRSTDRAFAPTRVSRLHAVRCVAGQPPPSAGRPPLSVREALVRPAARALGPLLLSLALVFGAPVATGPQLALALSGPAVKSSDSGVGLFVNKDGNSILRLALPRIAELPELYTAQELAETIKLRFDQVGFKRDPVWAAAGGDAGLLERKLAELEPQVLAKTPEELKPKVEPLFRSVQGNLRPLIAALREKNIGETLRLQGAVATELAGVQSLLFPAQTLPYDVPPEYAGLPQLRGRAEVEMRIVKGAKNKKRFCADSGSMYSGRFGMSYSEVKENADDLKGAECAPENTKAEATIRLTLDGYHAPVTAGNFANLVQSGFYDNIAVQQLTDLTIQTGNAKKAGKPAVTKPVPLELFYKRDTKPTYSFTSDEDRRGSETAALCAPHRAPVLIGRATRPSPAAHLLSPPGPARASPQALPVVRRPRDGAAVRRPGRRDRQRLGHLGVLLHQVRPGAHPARTQHARRRLLVLRVHVAGRDLPQERGGGRRDYLGQDHLWPREPEAARHKVRAATRRHVWASLYLEDTAESRVTRATWCMLISPCPLLLTYLSVALLRSTSSTLSAVHCIHPTVFTQRLSKDVEVGVDVHLR